MFFILFIKTAIQKEEMNCTEGNKIPCTHILTYHYNLVGKVKGNDFWVKAPNRKETKASLKVNLRKNVWYDYGTGKGGRPIDLVCYLSNVSVAGALLILSGIVTAPIESFSFDQQNSDSSIKIKHLQSLQNRALIQYLASRQISKAKAVNYVQEAYYLVNGKQYFALAFKNDKGGYELRNKYFKGSSSPKAITTIPGSRKAVSIFEGFLDFLSAIEFYQVRKPAGSCIILNSVSNLDAILSSLTDYQKINLYLDNDKTGIQAAQKIKQTHSRARVTDFSKIIYPEHKDMNELLVQTKKSTLLI